MTHHAKKYSSSIQPHSTTALILAAGEARRFGRPKQLLPWGPGKTILSHLIDQIRQTAGIGQIVLVLGAWRDEITTTLASQLNGVEIVINPDWRQGMFTSLRTGLQTVARQPATGGGILVLLGDMPFITSAGLEPFTAAARHDEPQPVIAAESGRPAHPYLIRSHHIGEILSLSGKSGIRPFIHKHFPTARKIAVPKAAGRHDIDTWESYFSRRPADSGPVIPPPPATADGL
jgi:CTP:molybdopterin cytidylyltransferase MocA